jgi:hypothetical protein
MVVVLIFVGFILLCVVLPIVLLNRRVKEGDVEAGGSWGREISGGGSSNDDSG